MNQLNFNQLYYFYVVAKEGSIKAASRKLHLTQPTISTQIKQLEEDLGHQLFERKHRKLVLNPVGKATLLQAERIFEMANHLKESLSTPGNKAIRDQFRVGAIQSLSNSFIYELFTGLWKSQKVQMEVKQGSLQELIQKLNDSEIDAVLTDHPFSNSKRYKSIRVSHDRLVAVGTPGLKTTKKSFPQVLDNLGYLGFSSQNRVQQDIEDYFYTSGIRPDLLGRADDVTLLRVVTEQAGCFSVIPERAAKEALKAKNLKRLGVLPSLHLDIWLTYSSVNPSAPMIRRMAKQYFKKSN